MPSPDPIADAQWDADVAASAEVDPSAERREKAKAFLLNPHYSTAKKIAKLEKWPELADVWQPPAADLPHDPEEPAAGPGGGEALGRGVLKGGSFGFNDELMGAAAAAGNDVPHATGRGIDAPAIPAYEAVRREEEGKDRAAQEAHPYLFGGGALAGGGAMAAGGGMALGAMGGPLTALDPFAEAALAGGGSGALSGAGNAQPGERGAGALKGGVEGAILSQALPAAMQMAGPLVAPLERGANMQRIKAFEHDTQMKRVNDAAPHIAEAEAEGVTPHNADERIRDAADALNRTLAEQVRLAPKAAPAPVQRALDLAPAEGQTLPVPAVPRGRQFQEPLPSKLPPQGRPLDLDSGGETLPVPVVPRSPKFQEPLVPRAAPVPREFLEEPSPVSQEELPLGPDPGKKVQLRQVRVDTRPVAEALRQDLAKIADVPANKAIRSRYYKAIASFESDEGLPLEQAIKQRQMLREKTYGPVGVKESVSAKEAGAQHALMSKQIDKAIAPHPELKAAYDKYNRQIEVANRVKELGKAPLHGPPQNAVQSVGHLVNFMGLPVNDVAATALRGTAGAIKQGGRGAGPGILAGQVPTFVPPSLLGMDEVRREDR